MNHVLKDFSCRIQISFHSRCDDLMIKNANTFQTVTLTEEPINGNGSNMIKTQQNADISLGKMTEINKTEPAQLDSA